MWTLSFLICIFFVFSLYIFCIFPVSSVYFLVSSLYFFVSSLYFPRIFFVFPTVTPTTLVGLECGRGGAQLRDQSNVRLAQKIQGNDTERYIEMLHCIKAENIRKHQTSEMENIKGSAEDEGSHHRFPFLLQICHFCASSIFNPFQKL